MIVFRALGFVSDRDILEHIIYDFSDIEMMEAVSVMDVGGGVASRCSEREGGVASRCRGREGGWHLGVEGGREGWHLGVEGGRGRRRERGGLGYSAMATLL